MDGHGQLPVGYFCTYAPRCSRLNISLKKNTTTLKFDVDLTVAVFKAMLFAKKIFTNRKYFFRIYNTGFFLKNVKVIKMPRGWISRLKNHMTLKLEYLEYCDR